MTWAQFASNWKFNLSAFMQRFPHTPEQALEQARIGPTALSRVIAQNHDLTEPEAREELEHFLDLQSLARAALDIRSHDPALAALK
ncbi:hypothetical protein OAA76_05660 [Planktotalea frisia]|jgi:hypothetical protein|nr:hypothetical protein [Planktotalea frisia]